jgi:hypothetical protein
VTDSNPIPFRYPERRTIHIRTQRGLTLNRIFPDDIERIWQALYESDTERRCQSMYPPSAFLIPVLDYLTLQFTHSGYVELGDAFRQNFPGFTVKPQKTLNRERLEFFWRDIPIFPVDSFEYSTALPLQALGRYLLKKDPNVAE